ncbi:DnaA/Hda family protein [Kiloniella laminariae]|uniref:DnaA/Hda family protein n=1 Tax=Kiloniella laminariae TaxID=454162 RepID=A0ABT4LHD9_9PROT|nr:DnaA/Hda family protein [Kiloniella laminariae]MCZ4280365.1 DnaA/Hda family protein [Kiloniella laminariae]
MDSSQLPLDLGHRPALGREDFLIAPCNELAVAWIDRWPDWPGHTLGFYGPSGCGKTHLAQVWRADSAAVLVTAEGLAEMDADVLLAGQRNCVVDDIVPALTKSSELQRRLFHLYNYVREEKGYLLFTGQEAPARWAVDLPDLASRLAAVPAFALGLPDDFLFEALLVKLFYDRQLTISKEVLRFLVLRLDRSFEAARQIVSTLDQASLASQREITIPFIRGVLEKETRA